MPALRLEVAAAAGIVSAYAAMLVIETLRPAVRRPFDLHWQASCLLHFALLAVVNNGVALAMHRAWPWPPLFDGARLHPLAGVIVGYLAVSLGNAVLHLSLHRNAWLWRHVHRYHHRPQRLDVGGVMHQSPLEMLANALLFSITTVWLLGLDRDVVLACGAIAAFYGMFQHLNTATPRWLGPWIQRPEAHSLHHARHVHAWNYSDFPPWDMLLGTYRSPERFHTDVGIDAQDADVPTPR